MYYTIVQPNEENLVQNALFSCMFQWGNFSSNLISSSSIIQFNKREILKRRGEKERDKNHVVNCISSMYIYSVGNKFNSARSKEEIVGLPRNPIRRDRHLVTIPKKSCIIYSSRSRLELYSKLNWSKSHNPISSIGIKLLVQEYQ
jgi:hypothetical protein